MFTKNNNLWITNPIIKDAAAIKKEKEEAEASKPKGKKDYHDGGRDKQKNLKTSHGDEKSHKAQKGEKVKEEEVVVHRWIDISKCFKSQK